MRIERLDALFTPGELAELGPGARGSAWPADRAIREADEVCREGGLAGRSAACFRGLVLLWHDHLDEAHALVQDLPGGDAAWVHGIMHRREPDYSNARYWFHRVGSHAALEALADEAAPELAAHAALPFRLIRDGRWDPFAFIDAVSTAVRHGEDPDLTGLLRRLQWAEARVLGRHLAGA